MAGRRERKAHLLSHLRKLTYPRRFLFFDSESTVDGYGRYDPTIVRKVHRPRLVESELWASDGGWRYRQVDAREFSGPTVGADFWRWASDLASLRTESGRASLVVIGHNVGYDVLATGGADVLHSLGWSSEYPYEKGPVYIWRFYRNERTVTLLSSTNFYLASLAEVGRTFGVPKLDVDTQTDDLDLLRTYCRRDVEIARRSILGLVEFLATGGDPERPRPLGPWGDTISSVAFKAFRFGYLPFDVEIHTNAKATAIERDGYFGGRTEVMLCGKPCPLPVYDLDVNSLYPSVMIDGLFPTRLVQVYDETTPERPTVQSLQASMRLRLVIARVEVETDVPAYPYKDKATGKLLFPTGRFTTTLPTPELEVALDNGHLHAVEAYATYDSGQLFAPYVADLYARRVAARAHDDVARVQLYKNLLNNLYGKFGQRADVWEIVGTCDDPTAVRVQEFWDVERQRFYVERVFGGVVYRSTSSTESYNAFPAVAAFVTSYARRRLWGLMNVAGNYDAGRKDARHGREFYYCDTDSLFVSPVGLRRLKDAGLVDPDRLGALKLVRAVNAKAVFYGAKVYEIDDEARHKGIPKDARSTWDDGSPVVITKGPHKGEPAVVYDAWPKLATAFKNGTLSEFANRTVVKRTDVEYDKGVVWGSGWVEPVRLPRPEPPPAEVVAP